jgi:hypothetical protein
MTRYFYVARMDVADDVEPLFNEIYDHDKLPAMRAISGVKSAARFVTETLPHRRGTENARIADHLEPRYTAVYELEHPSVVTSEAWCSVVEAGRWPSEIRPFIRNRQVSLKRMLIDAM